MEFFFEVFIFIALLSVGYFFGRFYERTHFRSIKKREKLFLGTPTVNYDFIPSRKIHKSCLVVGNVAVSMDYFKAFISSMKSFMGGRLNAYIPLMERARREALLRMKEQAPDANFFTNVRLETSAIGGQLQGKNSTKCIEVIAYGTALYYDVS